MQSRPVEVAAQRATTLVPTERPRTDRVPVLLGGMRTNAAGTDIDPAQSPSLNNLLVVDGQLVPDTGYVPFASGNVSGTPQATFHINNSDRTENTILVTTTNAYWLNAGVWTGGVSGWTFLASYGAGVSTFQLQNGQSILYPGLVIDIPYSAGGFLHTTIAPTQPVQMTITVGSPVPAGRSIVSGSTLNGWAFTATYTAGATSFVLNTTTPQAMFFLNQGVNIPLDNGTFYNTSIVALPTVTIQTVNAVATGMTVAAGAALNINLATLRGDPTLRVFGVPFPPNDWIIFTNGVDPPFYFYKGVFAVLPMDVPSLVCRSLAVFHESLYLIGMVSDSDQLPHLRRVRASDAANPAKFQTIQEGATTGIAAIYDLLDTDDDLHCAYPLGPWLILYRHGSIMRATYLGQQNLILFWEYMVTWEGAQSDGAVAPVTVLGRSTAYHFVLGTFNVYRYKGDYSLEAIGDNIWQRYFGANGLANQPGKSVNFVTWIGQWDELWIAFATGVNTVPDTVLRYSIPRGAWYPRTFAFGAELMDADVYLPSLENRTTPTILLTVTNPAQPVFAYDYKAQTDNGTAIAWTVQTKDFGGVDVWDRYDRIAVYGRGTCLVEYSTDAGVTFASAGTAAMGGSTRLRFVTLQAVGQRFRVRLSGTDPTFALAGVFIRSTGEAEWLLGVSGDTGGPFILGTSVLGGPDVLA